MAKAASPRAAALESESDDVPALDGLLDAKKQERWLRYSLMIEKMSEPIICLAKKVAQALVEEGEFEWTGKSRGDRKPVVAEQCEDADALLEAVAGHGHKGKDLSTAAELLNCGHLPSYAKRWPKAPDSKKSPLSLQSLTVKAKKARGQWAHLYPFKLTQLEFDEKVSTIADVLFGARGSPDPSENAYQGFRQGSDDIRRMDRDFAEDFKALCGGAEQESSFRAKLRRLHSDDLSPSETEKLAAFKKEVMLSILKENEALVEKVLPQLSDLHKVAMDARLSKSDTSDALFAGWGLAFCQTNMMKDPAPNSFGRVLCTHQAITSKIRFALLCAWRASNIKVRDIDSGDVNIPGILAHWMHASTLASGTKVLGYVLYFVINVAKMESDREPKVVRSACTLQQILLSRFFEAIHEDPGADEACHLFERLLPRALANALFWFAPAETSIVVDWEPVLFQFREAGSACDPEMNALVSAAGALSAYIRLPNAVGSPSRLTRTTVAHRNDLARRVQRFVVKYRENQLQEWMRSQLSSIVGPAPGPGHGARSG